MRTAKTVIRQGRCPGWSKSSLATYFILLVLLCCDSNETCQKTFWHRKGRDLMILFEPPHDKTNKMTVRPAKTQISLGIPPVWSESSLSALGPLATHWAHSEDSDQTGRMPRLIWVFAGHTATLLALSWRSSFLKILNISPFNCMLWELWKLPRNKTILWVHVLVRIAMASTHIICFDGELLTIIL